MQNKYCQSCGMPLKNDPTSGATNADGSKNESYCGLCYQNGAFTFEGTMDEFRKHCIDKMVEGGRNRLLAQLMMCKPMLRRLDRWKEE